MILAMDEEEKRLRTGEPDETEARYKTWRRIRGGKAFELKRAKDRLVDRAQGLEEALLMANLPNSIQPGFYYVSSRVSIPNWLEEVIQKYGPRASQIVQEGVRKPLNSRK